MRRQGRLRRPSGALLRATLPDAAWVLLAAGAVTWGWIAPRILPSANPCAGGHTFAAAFAVQAALLLGALLLTAVRGARLGMSGGAVALVAVAIGLPWVGGTLYIWLATGVCWHLTM